MSENIDNHMTLKWELKDKLDWCSTKELDEIKKLIDCLFSKDAFFKKEKPDE